MELTCRECRDFFSLFFDQELPSQDKGRMMEHLRRCKACAAEWQEFKNTVQFVHDMPMVSPPSDLLPGINAKLAPPGLLERISNRLGFSRPQTAFTTILATFVVGIVCASLVYLPLRPEQQPGSFRVSRAQSNSSVISRIDNQAVTTSPPVAIEPENFYPGIPSLAEYVPDMSPRLYQPAITAPASRGYDVPLVSPVSTGSHLSAFSSTTHTDRLLRPDVTITIKNGLRQNNFLRQLSHSGKWQYKIVQDKLLLLSMPPSDIAMLRHILDQQKLSYVQMSRPGAPKKILKVAVRLDY